MATGDPWCTRHNCCAALCPCSLEGRLISGGASSLRIYDPDGNYRVIGGTLYRVVEGMPLLATDMTPPLPNFDPVEPLPEVEQVVTDNFWDLV